MPESIIHQIAVVRVCQGRAYRLVVPATRLAQMGTLTARGGVQASLLTRIHTMLLGVVVNVLAVFRRIGTAASFGLATAYALPPHGTTTFLPGRGVRLDARRALRGGAYTT